MKPPSSESPEVPRRLEEQQIKHLCQEFNVLLDGEGGAAQHFVIEQKSGERLYIPLWEEVPTNEGKTLVPIRDRLEALVEETREEKAS